jgi:hypothetical protein
VILNKPTKPERTSLIILYATLLCMPFWLCYVIIRSEVMYIYVSTVTGLVHDKDYQNWMCVCVCVCWQVGMLLKAFYTRTFLWFQFFLAFVIRNNILSKFNTTPLISGSKVYENFLWLNYFCVDYMLLLSTCLLSKT